MAPGGLGSRGWRWWEPDANVVTPPQHLHRLPQFLLDGAWLLAHLRITSEAQGQMVERLVLEFLLESGRGREGGELCGVLFFAQQPDSLISPLWFQCLQ